MGDIYLKNRLNDNLIDLRKKGNHPLIFSYSEIYKECLLLGGIKSGRITPNFKLNHNAPFFLAAKSGIKNPDNCFQEVFKTLTEFYDNFQPKNVSDWFSLLNNNSCLKNYPAWASILPWRARTIDNYRKVIEQGTISDNLKNGLELDIFHSGWAYCGPVVKEKCEIETRRIVNLISSISEKGYQRNNDTDGDIVATALVNEKNEWVWLVTNGYHRVAVVAAMNYKSIPIRINIVVKRDEVDFWPQVVSKFYSKEEALTIFDNLFKP